MNPGCTLVQPPLSSGGALRQRVLCQAQDEAGVINTALVIGENCNHERQR